MVEVVPTQEPRTWPDPYTNPPIRPYEEPLAWFDPYTTSPARMYQRGLQAVSPRAHPALLLEDFGKTVCRRSCRLEAG